MNFKKKCIHKRKKVVTILYHNKIYTSEPYKDNVAYHGWEKQQTLKI